MITRRHFLNTAATSALAGSCLPPLSAGVNAAFGAAPGTAEDILVVIFLRFGACGLTLIPPADDGIYHDLRPTIGVSAKTALPIGSLDGTPLFMHPNFAELKALYDAGSLAVVHAAGIHTESRSHFVSQDMMERASTDGERPVTGGWLGRHMNARRAAPAPLVAMSAGAEVNIALQGYPGAVAVPNVLALFTVLGGDNSRKVIEAMNTGSGPLIASGQSTLATLKTVQTRVATLPSDDGNAAGYTAGALSTPLRTVAKLIKADVGLKVATVDFLGWDQHVRLTQGINPLARELSLALAAFWSDLKDHQGRLTIVTMTEFGRRVEENANGGTDHGSASVMLALGGSVNGGRIYGKWPGLKPADLHAGDLAVTTDYRQVLQEILVKRRGETTPRAVFPTLAYEPLGLVRGDDKALKKA
ncbi:MAG: DUF1501 domain-containing protein [Rhodospirillaceae bacterium]